MRLILKPLFVVISLAVLTSCASRSNREEGNPGQPDRAAQGKATEIQQGTQIIRTEEELSALLKSMLDTEKRTVSLIGKLDLVETSNFKHQVSTLVIGKIPLAFGHSLDKDKYHNQTVLVRADVYGYGFGETGFQRRGFWIVNVQHIEIVESP